MENNSTLISNELEEMRSQISVLKEKLDKQTIVNEEHIRRSMKSKMSDINKTVTMTIALGVFALIYSTGFFHSQGCSIAFVAVTFVMLAVCLGLTIGQKITLGRIDFSEGNLIDTAQNLSKIRTHYQNWHKIAIPTIIIWVGWMMYEMINLLGLDDAMALGFCSGALVGCIIGGILGYRINLKIIRKATEILDQIEEIQRG